MLPTLLKFLSFTFCLIELSLLCLCRLCLEALWDSFVVVTDEFGAVLVVFLLLKEEDGFLGAFEF
jgi:hypothetical protein